MIQRGVVATDRPPHLSDGVPKLVAHTFVQEVDAFRGGHLAHLVLQGENDSGAAVATPEQRTDLVT